MCRFLSLTSAQRKRDLQRVFACEAFQTSRSTVASSFRRNHGNGTNRRETSFNEPSTKRRRRKACREGWVPKFHWNRNFSHARAIKWRVVEIYIYCGNYIDLREYVRVVREKPRSVDLIMGGCDYATLKEVVKDKKVR